jgi:ferric-dicitrate binding protein FerR (iron transport regulator)
MPVNLSVEALVINDSFYNYCFHKNEADTRYWEEYIFNHPHEIEKIMEARRLVLGLSVVVNEEQDGNNETVPATVKPLLPGKNIFKQLGYFAAAAAAITAIVWGIAFWKKQDTLKNTMASEVYNNKKSNPALVFTSAKGERKLVTLPDGTLLHLNSGSTLQIDGQFAKTNRYVFLSGEALFDVRHNESLPFIVHVDSYDVKVLGTLFNVKAYAGDITNEVSLLRGKVEVLNRNNSKTTVLSPNHKLLIRYAGAAAKEPAQMLHAVANETKVLPLSYNKDSLVIETAWSQNRLEIVNEKFGEIKERLERWYNVEIDFEDAEVGGYSFTATFEDENIDQVLKALQYTYHFTYKTNGEQITISK